MSLSAVAAAQVAPPVAAVMEEQPGSLAPLRHEQPITAVQAQEKQSCLDTLKKVVGCAALAIFSAVPIAGMGVYFFTKNLSAGEGKLVEKTKKSIQELGYQPKVIHEYLAAFKDELDWNSISLLCARVQSGSGLALIPILLAELGILSSMAVAWPIAVGILGLIVISSIVLHVKENMSNNSKIKNEKDCFNRKLIEFRKLFHGNFVGNIIRKFENCETVDELERCFQDEMENLESESKKLAIKDVKDYRKKIADCCKPFYKSFVSEIIAKFDECKNIEELEISYNDEIKNVKSENFLRDMFMHKIRRALILTDYSNYVGILMKIEKQEEIQPIVKDTIAMIKMHINDNNELDEGEKKYLISYFTSKINSSVSIFKRLNNHVNIANRTKPIAEQEKEVAKQEEEDNILDLAQLPIPEEALEPGDRDVVKLAQRSTAEDLERARRNNPIQESNKKIYKQHPICQEFLEAIKYCDTDEKFNEAMKFAQNDIKYEKDEGLIGQELADYLNRLIVFANEDRDNIKRIAAENLKRFAVTDEKQVDQIRAHNRKREDLRRDIARENLKKMLLTQTSLELE